MMRLIEYLSSFRVETSVDKIKNLLPMAEMMRDSYRSMIPSAGNPDAVSRVKDISIPYDNCSIPLRIYHPNSDAHSPLPLILFIHGGGWVSGDLDTHDVLARAMCNGVNAIVIAIDYRLAPESPFPAALEDIALTLTWIENNAEQLGGTKHKIAIAGDSAGGNLAAVITQVMSYTGEIRISANWLIYPEVSFSMQTPSWQTLGNHYFPTKDINRMVMNCYIPEGMDPTLSLLSPLNGMNETLPPTIIQVGEYDPLRDECIEYGEKLKALNIPCEIKVYKEQKHGFLQFYKNKVEHHQGERALEEGIAFMRKYL